MIKENEQLYRDCLKFWGLPRQLRQCQEECGELIVAVSHYVRAVERKDPVRAITDDAFDKAEKNLIEETADVLLMVEQIMTFMGEEEVLDAARCKANRVQQKLKRKKDALPKKKGEDHETN